MANQVSTEEAFVHNFDLNESYLNIFGRLMAQLDEKVLIPLDLCGSRDLLLVGCLFVLA